jgi:hypothetical protein
MALNIKFKHIIILICMMISSICIFSTTIIGTIPLPIIVPFLLNLKYKDKKSIFIIGTITVFIASWAMEETGIAILLIPLSLIGMLFSMYASDIGKITKYLFFKENENTYLKNVVNTIIVIVLAIFSFNFYSDLKGNPITYIKAQEKLNSYINESYNDKFIIGEYSYFGLKGPFYSVRIIDKNNQDKDFIISYNSSNNYIDDEYYNTNYSGIADKINNNIQSTIIKKLNLYKENIEVNCDIGKLKVDYGISNKFSVRNPIDVSIYIIPEYGPDYNIVGQFYKNEGEFAEDVYEIIKILKSTEYDYKTVKFEASPIHNNLSETYYKYKITDINNVNSLDDVENNIVIVREKPNN